MKELYCLTVMLNELHVRCTVRVIFDMVSHVRFCLWCAEYLIQKFKKFINHRVKLLIRAIPIEKEVCGQPPLK